jgi:glutathione S-transferase
LLNQTFPDQTGSRPALKNIEAWMQRIEEGTKFSLVAEKELNIVK